MSGELAAELGADHLHIHTDDNHIYQTSGLFRCVLENRSKFLEFSGLFGVLSEKGEIFSGYDSLIYINDTLLSKHSFVLHSFFLKRNLRDMSMTAPPVLIGRLDRVAASGHVSTFCFLCNRSALKLATASFLEAERLTRGEIAAAIPHADTARKRARYMSLGGDESRYVRKLYDCFFEYAFSQQIRACGSMVPLYRGQTYRAMYLFSFLKHSVYKRSPAPLRRYLRLL
jgi:hypothetical protein